jgi:hypothetical protein
MWINVGKYAMEHIEGMRVTTNLIMFHLCTMRVGEQMVPSETHASETNNHQTLAYSMAMGQNPDALVVI